MLHNLLLIYIRITKLQTENLAFKLINHTVCMGVVGICNNMSEVVGCHVSCITTYPNCFCRYQNHGMDVHLSS